MAKPPARQETAPPSVSPKTMGQRAYFEAIDTHDITFGVGPAGTGKTFLAVAKAVEAYTAQRVEKIILMRPAVEAGEKLGSLPGDGGEKVAPFLVPLADAMAQIGGKRVPQSAIEIAPLAFLRGRTLSGAFIILDEAQNTTIAQMKMFLTRLGENSRMVVTGDMSQSDLPNYHAESGLEYAVRVVGGVNGVKVCTLELCDVVRHPLVARLVDAFERDRAQGRNSAPPAP